VEPEPRLLIQADAGNEIGTGHVMRCLALAQEWRRRGGEALFSAPQLPRWVRDRLETEGFEISLEVESAATLRNLVEEADPAWVILDVGPRMPDLLDAASDARTAVIDDRGGVFPAPPTLVVNQNADPDSRLYERSDHTTFLMGVRYVLLRDEFVRAAADREVPQTCRVVLLSLGGTDASGLLLPLAEALCRTAPFLVRAVTTTSHPRLPELREWASRVDNLELVEDVWDMADLMRTADLAVTSAGATVWELASQGVPALVGASSPYEEIMMTRLRELDLYDALGRFRDLAPSTIARRAAERGRDRRWRAHMAARAKTLVDGRGRQRVVDEMWRRL
jgi:UDP-2,4-diacetamido-2,4,6-trideoxy-beta-L-altropyranose hydrolase